MVQDEAGRVFMGNKAAGVMVDGVARQGFETPSRKLEFYSPTLAQWGWPEKEYVIPWALQSHVHPSRIGRRPGRNAAAAPTSACPL